MRLWMDILDANDALIDGPIHVSKASITRVLDGAGGFSVTVPAMMDGVEALTFERRLILYVEQNNGEQREIGRGIIRSLKAANDDRMLDVSGPDILGELKQRSVLLNRIYDQVTLGSELAALLALAGGWGLRPKDGATPTLLVDDRFDGINLLKAIAARLMNIGQHFRLSAYGKVLEYGTFGDDAGVMLIGGQRDTTHEVIFNDDVAVIDDLTVDGSSEDLCNRIVPVGSGEGEAALNLAYSTRTGPYPILSTNIGGKTVRYLQDDASIAEHGVHERVLSFDIAPIANNSVAVEVADNALYDGGAEYLIRYKDPYYAYDVGGVKLNKPLRPGQKLRLIYKGLVKTRSGDRMFVDVDDDMWVMKVREQFTTAGLSFDLELASIDRVRMDETEIIVGGIERAELRNLKPRAYPHRYSDTYYDTIQGFASESSPNFKSAKFQVAIDDSMTYLERCVLRILTHPPTTQAVGDVSMTTMLWSVYTATFHPRGLTIKINGTDYTSALGGPWGSGTEVDVELDVTDLLLAEGFRQTHSIEIKATETSIFSPNGRISSSYPAVGGLECGQIELSVRVWGMAQSILPT